jgi:hypothetical protein
MRNLRRKAGRRRRVRVRKTLAGDRGVEWGYVRERLPKGEGWVLDFGPMSDAQMSMYAIAQGYDVIAVGMEHLDVGHERLTYIQQDFLTVQLEVQFDWVINASTIEHVGLGRYGDPVGPDLDLQAMAKLRGLMKPGGIQLMTCPIGKDASIGHWHRVYGAERLPRLLEGYQVREELYWVKTANDREWVSCPKGTALAEEPGRPPVDNMIELSYGLGCFMLTA